MSIEGKEADVIKAVASILDLSGIYFWRNSVGAVSFKASTGKRFVRFGFPGSADFLGITNDGRFLAVECKRPKGGVVSEKQKKFLANISARGGVALVVRSGEELIEKLKAEELI